MNLSFFKISLFSAFLLLSLSEGLAQVAINGDGSAPATSAMLEVVSTDKGFLTPRMTKAQRDGILTPAIGLLIFQSDNTSGFYYFNGTIWTFVGITSTQAAAITTNTEKTGITSTQTAAITANTAKVTNTDDQTLAEVLTSNNSAGSSTINMNSNKITSLATPTADTDAATKAYVDSKTTTSPTYTMGVNAALGGYVFYVTPNGKHGLVAANQDQSSSVSWYGRDDVLNDPANHDDAGKEFTDWRMPTKRELNLMYLTIGQGAVSPNTNIGDFTSEAYWSSTESSSGNAWAQNFVGGNQSYVTKSFNGLNVRAVRAF